MAQIPVKTSIIAVLTVLSSPAFADPGLTGRWRGELGTLRFETEAQTGAIVGHFEAGGSCGFLPGQGVFEGVLKGNVIAGRVMLCQSGPQCPAKFYPALAVVNRADNSLAAYVKLDEGCTSPVLADNRIVLLPAEDAELAADRSNGASSAAMLARVKVDKRAAERADRAYANAVRAISQRNPDYQEARLQAQDAVSLNREHWKAYMLLGVAEMKLDNPDAALDAYRRSQLLNGQNADVHYNLACAYAKLKQRERAVSSLRTAVELGFDGAQFMLADEDLSSVFGPNDPEFKQLLGRAEQNKLAAKKKPGKGSR